MGSIILSFVLGAILSIGGGLLLEYLRLVSWERRTRRFLRLVLTDQANRAKEILQQVVEIARNVNDVPPLQLIDLAQITYAFQPHRNSMYLVADDNARSEILNFFSRLERAIYYTAFIRQYLTDATWGTWARNQMPTQIQEFRDLANAAQRLSAEVLAKIG